ncbi:cAMP-dependent protein kinase inhibitor beta isoform X1 [Meriones unguiculatus]|uniref:cAMP-dependent protein kinase inhibitor beta isoform X1 n=2 Tax=Meriones unguiculatus TaxID=10047 RepID=UPI00293E3D4F|nr:cAMP-dependent protein kinase inhibitor beta isoform X1 [Meriones unguiculatus]XP_060229217.1 cAMP-dependent protein kinase inhibitor beta isoform X1 [Meriones unguiculatus]XP_060229218.1 cAMP-dependent protein kinase inhibitor beta isoform X1 [Meriones unguiculatus]XP_060229219.1 cAMP-dependent protein kinase inhibitor beta isoform X1 [Meriones unguiculatus]
MDGNPDALVGQKNTSDSSKGGDSPGAQQGSVMKTDSLTMTDVQSVIDSFAASGRAGRRNALPDIQSSMAAGGSSELPIKLESVSVKEDVKQNGEEKDQDQLEKPLNEEK